MSKLTDKIQVRIDPETKKQAQETLSDMGLNMSSAVKMFLQQVITRQAMPFRARTENGFTPEREAEIIKQTEEALKNGKRYESAEEMHADILKEDGDNTE